MAKFYIFLADLGRQAIHSKLYDQFTKSNLKLQQLQLCWGMDNAQGNKGTMKRWRPRSKDFNTSCAVKFRAATCRTSLRS